MFSQASHVTMSINKLLNRIVAPRIDPDVCSDADQQAAFLHDHTCGITSDPLTQFAVVLSGLIHDLDHPGVSNGQLIKEDPRLAKRYKEKSVAEQNSVDLAWDLLMLNEYNELRAAIFSTETELRRFRNLLVNSIIATDIFDKELGTLRKNRWNKAFYETTQEDSSHEVKSRKATIVIEHLIQASDVAHTMQHWHVYQKWNQRLFDEMMMAYRDGRSDKDPSLGWYQGELWFFNNYVIPLTKKLKDCGVFGVSSDEYLNYALHNRDEWEAKGQEIVQQYQDDFEKKQIEERSMQPARVAL
jgi:3'5'-cyclic nucleotide phosphodiesterase